MVFYQDYPKCLNSWSRLVWLQLLQTVKLIDKMSLGAGALIFKGGRAYSTKGEPCLGGNHGNQASANHPAPSH